MTAASDQPKTYVLLALIVLSSSAGNVLFSKGMKEIGSVRPWSSEALVPILFKVFANGWIWLGIGCQLFSLVLLLIVLSRADYSYVLPASAAGYAVVVLLGYGLLGEKVPPMRWVGVAVICLGVSLVGATPPRTGK
jgi:drug/metabolite transporter (DMT)-like permease